MRGDPVRRDGRGRSKRPAAEVLDAIEHDAGDGVVNRTYFFARPRDVPSQCLAPSGARLSAWHRDACVTVPGTAP